MDSLSSMPPAPPRRRASGAGQALHYPSPSMESLPSVERLEASAEKLTSMGRNIGEEIRKMSIEQKRQQSAHSSMSPRSSRMRSNTSFPFSTSIDETSLDFPAHLISESHNNSQEPYFSHSFVRSSQGSVRSRRSGSGSHRSLKSLQKSITRTSQLPEPEQEGRPLDSPLTHSATGSPQQSHQFESMFATWEYDPIPEGGDYDDGEPNDSHVQIENTQTRQHLEGNSVNNRLGAVHRNPSTASRSTYVPASLFRDFDGVHYTSVAGDISEEAQSASGRHTPSTDQGHTPMPLESQVQWGESILYEPKNQWVEPPPGDDMVYYPAPVPMTLNLPKRLSQQPAAATQAQRRSQVLSTLPFEARKSALWLGREQGIEEEQEVAVDGETDAQNETKPRQSRLNFKNIQNLPPQLRASAFFDHTPVYHNLEIKNGSAMATLESMLDESARAPVPDASKVGTGQRKKHKPRRSTVSILNGVKSDVGKSEGRQSRASLFSRPRSSTDKMSQMRESNYSRLSMTSEHDDENEPSRGAESSTLLGSKHEEEGAVTDDLQFPSQVESDHGSGLEEEFSEEDVNEVDEEEDHEDEEDDEENDDVPDLDRYHGPPTTLLAELQLRKAQQRQRNRTAVTAFPHGMHSTLLELDAVAQIERKKRNKARTTLAWEDPKPSKDKDDDDVPLGMLYPESTGMLSKKKDDWDRPLGLIEKRELEDNEPLSRRRNRLKGFDPRKAAIEAQAAAAAAAARAKEEEEEAEKSEHEGETLAERTKRLKSKKALNDAIGADAEGNRPGSADLATDIMSLFPTDEEKKAKEAAKKAPVEETLGQRRKRLQAEALAAANGGDTSLQNERLLAPLRSTQSLANLLASNPVSGYRSESKNAQLSGLVGQSEQQRQSRRQELIDKNQRSASYATDGPLVEIAKAEDPGPTLSKFAAGKYNDGSGGTTLQQQQGHRQGYGTNNVDFTTGLLAAQQHISTSQQVASANALAQQFAAQSGHLSFFPQSQQTPQFPQQNLAHQSFGFPQGFPPFPQFQQQTFQQIPNLQSQNFSQQNFTMPGYSAPGMYPSFDQTASIMQGAQPAMMTPSQRDNIDRWRQSIV